MHVLMTTTLVSAMTTTPVQVDLVIGVVHFHIYILRYVLSHPHITTHTICPTLYPLLHQILTILALLHILTLFSLFVCLHELILNNFIIGSTGLAFMCTTLLGQVLLRLGLSKEHALFQYTHILFFVVNITLVLYILLIVNYLHFFLCCGSAGERVCIER